MVKYISVGKILNFHGIKGEARVGYSKNQQDFLASLHTVFIKQDNEYVEFDILPYKGCLLFVEEDVVRENLDEDEFLIDELVGLEVFDSNDGKKLGFVIGVSNNGASDLISVKTNSKKICLVPFVKAIVPVVDIKNKKIMLNNIEGLLE